VSEVVGFGRTAGFMIASCSYIGTEMEKEQTTQQILEMQKAMQKKADTDREADQAKADADENKFWQEWKPKWTPSSRRLVKIRARIDTNTKEIKGMENATQERMNANLKDLREEFKSGQAEMRSIICTFRSELKESIQR
jgi:hypothetical protein